MIEMPVALDVRKIVVEEVLPHAQKVIWRALTTGDLIGRWLMPPAGFEAVEGREFTFQTKAAGAWDGVIKCRVLEVAPHERFAFAWRGGHEDNAGYGSRLDTVVTFTLEPTAGGTRLRLVHAGFELPRNAFAFKNMSEGWCSRIAILATVVGELN
jgi:uncharacterized protein YndB with AHSA1/START domain